MLDTEYFSVQDRNSANSNNEHYKVEAPKKAERPSIDALLSHLIDYVVCGDKGPWNENRYKEVHKELASAFQPRLRPTEAMDCAEIIASLLAGYSLAPSLMGRSREDQKEKLWMTTKTLVPFNLKP